MFKAYLFLVSFIATSGGVGVGAVLQKAKVQTVLSTSQLDASGANQRDAAAAVSTSCINFSPQIQPASPDTTTQIQQPSPILSPKESQYNQSVPAS